MTLDEAIKHCEDVAEDRCGCAEDCVEEHRQLAEWLKELKALRAEQTEPQTEEGGCTSVYVSRVEAEPFEDDPYIDIETGILHWCGWKYRRIYEDEPQKERTKTLDYCDICNHKGCDNCIANNLDDYCVPSGYEPITQTETQI